MTTNKKPQASGSGPTRREFLQRSAAGSVSALLVPQIAHLAPAGQRAELQTGWRIVSAQNVSARDEDVSKPAYDASHWHAIPRMPATVLQALEDAGEFSDLYLGMNLTHKVPADLWKQDWWYRVTFDAPEAEVYSLIFNGINYRADIWLNGRQVADKNHVVGMYNSFEFIVSKYILSGRENVLAVKVTPERKLPDVDGVELADSWLDWINWKYLGYHDAARHADISFVPDRNAGVWKRVFLSTTGKVLVRNPCVVTDLPLPATRPAALTVYCDLRNGVSTSVSGTLRGEISRPGKPTISFQQKVELAADETKEVVFDPATYTQLTVHDPDLWWPYEWGEPALYQLKLEFSVDGKVSDTSTTNFGIRKITQHRDADNDFPQVGTGGNFYLKVNGTDFLMRGGCYTPDLLFKNDPHRDRAIINYSKDMGMNMLRWELKIADDTMLDRADREGMPAMQGWMCCMQWEKWKQWDAEDRWVALASLRARIRNLRQHPAAFIWANGSDGRAPDDVRAQYHQILKELHWQNAVVDTVSNYAKDAAGHTLWDGIHMLGPYSWRPPYYWFNGQFPAAQGSCAEQGDNESIPPFESLKKFIPADKLWPVNEYWYYHSGANRGNSTLDTIQKAVEMRYGKPTDGEDLCRKAQLAHYENTRAQFENFAADAEATHKMSLYWMLNSQWPSFFGHLIDYYLKPGGAYFGAKKGLRPLSLVFDYYATGDRRTAHIYVVNQTLAARRDLKATVRFYNLDGSVKFSKELTGVNIGPATREEILTIPRIGGMSSTYFVRCQLSSSDGAPMVDNLYWQSTTDDDIGGPQNETAFILKQVAWADFTALNTMPGAEAGISGSVKQTGDESRAKITITNNSSHIAFFMRAEVTRGPDGEEVLPITYEDNYVTLFPSETRTLWAKFRTADLSGRKAHLRLEGYNVSKQTDAMA
ncbi:MAG TPA: glycoside hydrolase [Terriglobia bacterium]|nr:glycoside hydrolase [Terriglobia bacterium]